MFQTLTGVAGIAGVVMWAADRLMGRAPRDVRREPAQFAGRSAPPRFTSEQAARFTRIDAGARVFDVARARSIVEALRFRSATQVALPGVDPRSGVYAWEIGPLRGDRECAAEVFERASARGMVVLGSLSLILLRTGHPVESVLIAAPNGMIGAHLATPHGELAILSVTEPVRAAVEAPSPSPMPVEPASVVEPVPAPPVAQAAPPQAPAPATETASTAEPVVIGQVAIPRKRKEVNGAASPKSEAIDEPAGPAANA
jgi:hypothetical protein